MSDTILEWTAKGKTLSDLRQEHTQLTDEGTAIVDLAKEQGEREFTDEEDARITYLAEVLPQVRDAIEVQQQRQAKINQLAKSRVLKDAAPDGGGVSMGLEDKMARNWAVPRVSRVQSAHPGLTEHEAAQILWLGGHWLKNQIRMAKNQPVDQASLDRLNDAGWGVQNQQVIGTDLLGGNLTPKPLAQMLIDNRELVGITRQLVDIIPMSANTEDVPKAGTGLTVYDPGEATAITASTYNTAQVNLIARKRAILNQMSTEVQDDAIMSMTDRAMMEMGRALAQQEDLEFVNGDGTAGEPNFGVTGLISSIAATGGVHTLAATNDNWTDITADDLAIWMGLLPSQFGADTAIICSRQFYWQVLMKHSQSLGGTTLTGAQAGPTDGRSRVGGWYMGVPCYFTSQMPEASAVSTISALYGDFSASVMLGDRTGTRIAISVDYAFNLDVTTLRATSRYDIQVHEGDPAGDGSAAGGYVGISTGSTT